MDLNKELKFLQKFKKKSGGGGEKGGRAGVRLGWGGGSGWM